MGLTRAGQAIGLAKFGPLLLGVALALAGVPRRRRLAPATLTVTRAFVVYVAWSFTVSWGAHEHQVAFLRLIAFVCLFVLTFHLVPRYIGGEAAFRTVLCWSGLPLGIVVALATNDALAGSASRIDAGLNNPNFTGWICGVAAVLSVALGLSARIWPHRLLWFAAFVASAFALVGTGCRSALLFCVIAAMTALAVGLYHAAAHRRKETARRLALALTIAGAVAFAVGARGRSELLSERVREAGLAGRGRLWSGAIEEIAREPFLGHGFGAEGTHSSYLAIAYSTGIVGAVLYAVFMLAGLVGVARAMLQPGATAFTAVLGGLVIGMLAAQAFECGQTSAAFPPNIILWTVMGVLVGGRLSSGPSEATAPRVLSDHGANS